MVLITLALPIGGLPGEPLRMPTRLVALDEAPNITLDRQVVVVGRHPSCDAPPRFPACVSPSLLPDAR